MNDDRSAPRNPPLEGEFGAEHDAPPAPWSFKIMIVLVAIYLLYRLAQGVVWVVERLF